MLCQGAKESLCRGFELQGPVGGSSFSTVPRERQTSRRSSKYTRSLSGNDQYKMRYDFARKKCSQPTPRECSYDVAIAISEKCLIESPLDSGVLKI